MLLFAHPIIFKDLLDYGNMVYLLLFDEDL